MDGFLGAEWWVQTRDSCNPKENHVDTAISWYILLLLTRLCRYEHLNLLMQLAYVLCIVVVIVCCVYRCRDNGWPVELWPSCHFYPSIGSVFYVDEDEITAQGQYYTRGPTGDACFVYYCCQLVSAP